MRSTPTDARVDLWQALGQIVPHVESPDTLGTAIATALHKAIGDGQTAVALRTHPLAVGSADSSPGLTFFLRLVSGETPPSRPIYLDGERGILSQLKGLKDPLRLSAPWPADCDPANDELLQLARERLVIVPIPGSGRQAEPSLHGAVCLLDVPPERLPPPGELISLASFTKVALHLLESKIGAARQSVEYGIISEIGRSLTSSLSLDDIFEQIFTSVSTAIDCSAVSVGLIEPETRDVVFEKSLMGPRFSTLPTVRLKQGQGVAGWVAETGRPLNLPDASADPRWYPGVDAVSGFVTRSILCVPLLMEDQVIGVMEVINKRTGHFTNADERLLSALGSSVAIAIEKARLHADVLSEKSRMEAIFANMGEGLLTANLNGRITALNPALQAMIGANGQSLVGRECCEAIQVEPNELESLLAHTRSAELRREPFHAACDIIRPDGVRVPVLVSGAAARDDSGDASEIVIVFSDLRKVRELERMKEDFVANITHELRTPLATILLYARLLRAGKAKGHPDREARYLEIVEHQSNQLQKLVRQVLELSRMEATLAYPSLKRVQLDTLFDELLVSYRNLAHQKGLLFSAEVPAGLPAVVGDGEALRLVFGNLMDNAIKFTPRGQVSISARQCEGGVQVDVSDQGIGIAPGSVPYLFQRFYRTEAAVERGIGGTGLGLALVKETIEKLGGEIRVSSQPGKGSTFSVVLPTAEVMGAG